MKVTIELELNQPHEQHEIDRARVLLDAMEGKGPVGHNDEARETAQAERDTSAAEAEAQKKAEATAKRKKAAAEKKVKEVEEAALKAKAEAEEENFDLDGDDEEELTLEKVREALKAYAAANGKAAAIKILKDNDASSMSALKEDKFAAVMKAIADAG